MLSSSDETHGLSPSAASVDEGRRDTHYKNSPIHELISKEHDGLCFIQNDYTFSFIDADAAIWLYGIFGKSFDVLAPLPAEGPGQVFRRALDTAFDGSIVEHEFPVHTPGVAVPFTLRFVPIKNKNEVAPYTSACIFFHQRTLMQPEPEPWPFEIQDLHQQIVFLECLMDNSLILAWVNDANGNLYYANSLYKNLFLDGEEPKGRSIFNLFPPEIAAEYHENNKCVLDSGETVRRIEKAPYADGTIHTFKSIRFPVWYKSELMVGGWALDISRVLAAHDRELSAEKDKRRDIIRTIIETQESERSEIVIQMRDSINQTLSSAKVMLETASTEYTLITTYLNEAMEAMRNMYMKLNVSMITDIGFTEALSAFIENFEYNTGLEVDFQGNDDMICGMSATDQVALFRIVQDFLLIQEEYNQGTVISISLSSDSANIILIMGCDKSILNEHKSTRHFKNIVVRVQFLMGILHEYEEGGQSQLRIMINTNQMS